VSRENLMLNRIDQEYLIAPTNGKLQIRVTVVTKGYDKFDAIVFFKSNRELGKSFEAPVKVQEQPTIITHTIDLPPNPRLLFNPLEIFIIEENEAIWKERLPALRIVNHAKYFEYIVAEKLKELGFRVFWTSLEDPRGPDIVAYPMLFEGRSLDVQCTMRREYNVEKLYQDYTKFITERNRYLFSQLLIVTHSNDITDEVLERLHALEHSTSLISYGNLLQLYEGVRRNVLSRSDAQRYLLRKGYIEIRPIFSIDTQIPLKRSISYLVEF